MIKRILVLSACIVALIGVLVFPASADVLNYEDYVVNVEVDGANDLVTLRFPTDGYFFWITDEQYGFVNETNPVFYANLVPGKEYSLNFFPFYRDRLGLTNIPNGTTFNCSFELHKNTPNWESVNMDNVLTKKYLAVKYYNIAGEFISNPNFGVETSYEDGIFNFSSTINYPSGTNDGSFYFVFRGFSVDEPLTMGFSVLDFSMTMSISALYRDQESSGTTNRLLDVVRKELEANGQTLEEVLDSQQQTNDKLDNIINGEVGSTPPSGGGAVGDLDNAEGQIRDDAQSGLDQGLDVQQSALEILTQYWSAFACVSWIFNKFADLPFFSALLYMSFALGITGAILGLGLSLARAGDARAARQAAAEARQNSYYRRLGRGRKGG